MKKTIFFIAVLIILILNGCNTDNSSNKPKTAEELKMELKQREQASPSQYLSATGTMSENRIKIQDGGFFQQEKWKTDGFNIEGTIKNNASVARFKDAVLTIIFYSETMTVLEQKDYVSYQYFDPNSVKSFSVHVYPPDAERKWGLRVKTATPVN